MAVVNEPAFPCEVTSDGQGGVKGIQTGNRSGIATGLSKREWFAGLAMQGLLTAGYDGDVAREAVQHADELLRQLSNDLAEKVS